MDACRNEVRARNVDVDKVTVPRGVAALFSCGPGQKAFETDKLGKGHGVFFHFVLQGLKGEAKNGDGEVAWDDLGRYVRRQVTRQVAKVVGGGAAQTPHVITNVVGESPVLVGAAEEEVKKDDSAALRRELETLKAAIESKKLELKELERRGDARFAGLALTGKRVVFLVDTSGSMEMLDEKTEAPNKWAEVCDTVARLMRSMPALEKYQIVCFSTKTSFPLGKEGKWLDFDPKNSPEQARKALKQIKPRGGTNMHAGLEAAFKFRPERLDAVYLLSDGLPNDGEGITEQQRQQLKEPELGQLLGRHVRKKLKEQWNKPGNNSPRVKINTIGFYYESPDLGAFLWALARENDGGFVGMSKP
jgi:hypothetical protein